MLCLIIFRSLKQLFRQSIYFNISHYINFGIHLDIHFDMSNEDFVRDNKVECAAYWHCTRHWNSDTIDKHM